jgi:hypothetical protein
MTISPLGGENYPSPLAGWAQSICGFTALWTLITLGFLPSKSPKRLTERSYHSSG